MSSYVTALSGTHVIISFQKWSIDGEWIKWVLFWKNPLFYPFTQVPQLNCDTFQQFSVKSRRQNQNNLHMSRRETHWDNIGKCEKCNCTAYRVEKFNLTPVFFSVRQVWKLLSIKSDKDEYNQMCTCDLKCILHSFNQKFKSNILPCAHISYSSDSKECKECNI